mgnify:FL=1
MQVASEDAEVIALRRQLALVVRKAEDVQVEVRSRQAVASAVLRRTLVRMQPLENAALDGREALARLELRCARQRIRAEEDAAVVVGGRALVEQTVETLRANVADLASLHRGSSKPPKQTAASTLQMEELVKGKRSAAVNELIRRPVDACSFHTADGIRQIMTRLQQELGLLRLEVAALPAAGGPTIASASASSEELALAERDLEAAKREAEEIKTNVARLVKARNRFEKGRRELFNEKVTASLREQLEEKLGGDANQVAHKEADCRIAELGELYGVTERTSRGRLAATLEETRFVELSKWRNAVAAEKERATEILTGEFGGAAALEDLFTNGGAALLESEEHRENERTLRELSAEIGRASETQAELSIEFADMRTAHTELETKLARVDAVARMPRAVKIGTRAEVVALAASRSALAAMKFRVDELRRWCSMNLPALASQPSSLGGGGFSTPRVHVNRHGSVSIGSAETVRVGGSGASPELRPLSAPRWMPINLAAPHVPTPVAATAPVPPPPPPRIRYSLPQPQPQPQSAPPLPQGPPPSRVSRIVIKPIELRPVRNLAPSPPAAPAGSGSGPGSGIQNDMYDDLLATIDSFASTLGVER